MKKVLTLLAVGLMVNGMVGCTSAPKVEEPAADTTVSSLSEEESDFETPAEEKTITDDSASSTTSSSDLSLGAGSSGRGH